MLFKDNWLLLVIFWSISLAVFADEERTDTVAPVKQTTTEITNPTSVVPTTPSRTEITEMAFNRIENGMLDSNVAEILGPPELSLKDDPCEFLYYGNIWIWTLDKVVKGYVTVDQWQGADCWKYYHVYNKFVPPKKSLIDSLLSLFD